MSDNTVKNLIEQYIEDVWNRADLERFEAMTAEGFAYQLAGHPAMGREGMKQFLGMVHSAFPDWRVEIQGIVCDGTQAAVRWTGKATHQGVFHGIEPTGKTIDVSGINFYVIDDGKITQEFEQMDSLGMLKQMGVIGG